MDPHILGKQLDAAFHLDDGEKRPLTLSTDKSDDEQPQCMSFFDWDSSDSESETTTPTTKRWRSKTMRKQLPRRVSRADSVETVESTASKTARLLQRLSTYAMPDSTKRDKDEKTTRPRIGSV